MNKQQYKVQRDALNQKVLEFIRDTDPQPGGVTTMALGDVLMCYGLKILSDVHGNEVVAKHLARLVVQFEQGGSFDKIANLN